MATFSLLYLQASLGPPFPVPIPIWALAVFSVAISYGLLGMVYAQQKFQASSLNVNRRLRRKPYLVKVSNPSDKVVYDCRYNDAPLVDLTFDGTISDKLTAVSMVEETVPHHGRVSNALRFLAVSYPTRKILVITLNGRAEGTLTIQEYA